MSLREVDEGERGGDLSGKEESLTDRLPDADAIPKVD